MKKPLPLLVIVVILAVNWYISRGNQPLSSPAPSRPAAVETSQPEAPRPTDRPRRQNTDRYRPAAKGPYQSGPYTVSGVEIIDIHTGRTLPLGTVDLQPTLRRISEGKKNRHANDGTVWQNRARSLPRKPEGYYHEYVVPTPGVSGPGPRRLIIGRDGEIYYTPDHYETFVRLEKEE